MRASRMRAGSAECKAPSVMVASIPRWGCRHRGQCKCPVCNGAAVICAFCHLCSQKRAWCTRISSAAESSHRSSPLLAPIREAEQSSMRILGQQPALTVANVMAASLARPFAFSHASNAETASAAYVQDLIAYDGPFLHPLE